LRLYAVVSDIHGNWPALKAVEQDARAVATREGFEQIEFICLGDVVDALPQPAECLEWVRTNTAAIVQGNHDKGVAQLDDHPPLRRSIAPVYWPLTYWTRRVLDGLDDIQAWPKVWAAPAGLDAFTLHHSGLTREDEYILTIPSASGNFLRLGTPFGLFGHTHVQACFFQCKDGVELFLPCAQALPVSAERAWTPMPLDTWIPLPGRGSKALINPGSVGLPRQHPSLKRERIDSDARAAYLLLKLESGVEGEFQFRQVSYDVRDVVALLRLVRWPEGDDETAIEHIIQVIQQAQAGSEDGGQVPQTRSSGLPGPGRAKELNRVLTQMIQETIQQSIVPGLIASTRYWSTHCDPDGN
jgi:predicted phosphodiesterase